MKSLSQLDQAHSPENWNDRSITPKNTPMLQSSYQTQRDMNRIDISSSKPFCPMGHFILRMSYSQFKEYPMAQFEMPVDYNYLILQLNYFGTLYAQ
jgi:hypothetical protein